jgi:type IX secretion system PorP/SprF family membrane protein
MKRTIPLFILFLIGAASLRAQQFTPISQYMLNPGYLNPAYSGTGELYSFSLLYRGQWSGYRDYRGQAVAPQLQLFNGIANIDNTGHTVGLMFTQDKTASIKDFQALASYAYRVRISSVSTLSFGARFGINSRTIDFQKYTIIDPDDPNIPQGKQSETHPDLTLGLWYNHENYYLGVSGKSLISGSDALGFEIRKAYVITGGYHIPVSASLKVTPSAQLITSAGDFMLDASILASHNDVLWGGLSYRHERAAAAIVGVGLLQKKLRVSYAFDYTTNNAKSTGNTSHEIMLNLRIGELKQPKGRATLRKSRVKAPRNINVIRDRDRDEVPDDKDKCPDVRGLKKFDGCPDKDNDGIPDGEDKCPDVSGVREFEGCPDTDGDGVQDSEDACVNQRGTAAFNGCPDTDKDGVADPQDECPQVPGLPEHKGCPASFTQEKLGHVIFETGKATLETTSYTYLDEVIAVLKKYPDTKIVIEGHTDSEGDDADNLKLSQQRAETIREYFIEKGIRQDRITITGHGESKPVDTNDTAEGRKHNRRVEIHFTRQ